MLATDALLLEDELLRSGGGTTFRIGRACSSSVTISLVVGAKILDDDFGDEAEADDDLSLRPMRGGCSLSTSIAVAAIKTAKTVNVLKRLAVIVPNAMQFGSTANEFQRCSNSGIDVKM